MFEEFVRRKAGQIGRRVVDNLVGGTKTFADQNFGASLMPEASMRASVAALTNAQGHPDVLLHLPMDLVWPALSRPRRVGVPLDPERMYAIGVLQTKLRDRGLRNETLTYMGGQLENMRLDDNTVMTLDALSDAVLGVLAPAGVNRGPNRLDDVTTDNSTAISEYLLPKMMVPRVDDMTVAGFAAACPLVASWLRPYKDRAPAAPGLSKEDATLLYQRAKLFAGRLPKTLGAPPSPLERSYVMLLASLNGVYKIEP